MIQQSLVSTIVSGKIAYHSMGLGFKSTKPQTST